MPTYDVTVMVHYYYEVEADNDAEAEKLGWMYEDHPYSAEVHDISVEEQDEEISDWLSGDEVEAEDE
jgi:hypothetical protein